MTSTATTADPLDHLALLIHALRPDWETWLVRQVLHAHRAEIPLNDLTRAAVNAACDPSIHTAKAMMFRGRHWSGLESQPPTAAGPRCTVCGKPEGRCLTERPGPDDHAFEPTR